MRLASVSDLLPTTPSSPKSPSRSSPLVRATTEDYALDSYQNLLFSVARFREYTGAYPRKITIVGYEFKRKRFEHLHRAAVRWSPTALKYVGLSLGGSSEEREASNGEVRR